MKNAFAIVLTATLLLTSRMTHQLLRPYHQLMMIRQLMMQILYSQIRIQRITEMSYMIRERAVISRSIHMLVIR